MASRGVCLEIVHRAIALTVLQAGPSARPAVLHLGVGYGTVLTGCSCLVLWLGFCQPGMGTCRTDPGSSQRNHMGCVAWYASGSCHFPLRMRWDL